MRRLPLTLRLAFAFALAMALLFTVVGSFLYVRLADDLERALDQSLRGRAQDVSALVRRHGALASLDAPLVERGEVFAELLAPDGRVVDATPPLNGERLLSARQLGRAHRRATFVDLPSLRRLDEPVRMLAVPINRDGTRLVLVVGATRENRAEALRSLRRAFLVGGPLALLLASLAGYLLARGALRPIELMRRRAATISTSSLDERLPVPGAADEVGRLGSTLNEMLERIESGVARERRFVADASHELRTPLALLQTELELALHGSRSREELEGVIRSAAAEADRLARIAETLLLLARSESGRMPLHAEPTDLYDLIEAVAARFRSPATLEGHAISVAPGTPIVVDVDRLRMEQALGNLVDNALRHGSTDVTVRVEQPDGRVEVHVVDRGPGFPPGFLDQAFERFSRGDEAHGRGGSGLGLAIVATIARAHNGESGAANRADGGADAWFSVTSPSSSSADR